MNRLSDAFLEDIQSAPEYKPATKKEFPISVNDLFDHTHPEQIPMVIHWEFQISIQVMELLVHLHN